MTVPPLFPLFDAYEESARARLLASGLGRPRPGTKNVDLFAGGGGWGLAARRLGLQVHFAINHSEVAIATHAENFPNCVHHRGDAWKVRPRAVVGNDEIDILFASAACTTHSNARGGVPISKRVHMLGWCIARWIHDVRPRLILVENVAEWLKWGPLVSAKHANGRFVRDEQGKIVLRPDKAREGQHFKRWVRQCRRLGYVVEWRVMDAADYGEASRRKRLFVQMRRDGAPIVWPEVTHGLRIGGREINRASTSSHWTDSGARAVATGESDVLASRHGKIGKEGAQRLHKVRVGAFVQGESVVRGHKGITPYRTAADIIDWSDLGRSLFVRKATRKKPYGLAPKSIGRICEGIVRFVLSDAEPFLLSTVYGDKGWHITSMRDSMPTQTTRQDLGVCTPVLGVMAHGDGQDGTKRWGRPALPVDGPLNAIHAGGNNFGVASAVLTPCGGPKRQPDRADVPMQTLLTREDRAIATPVMATIGYGERDGQRPRCSSLDEPTTTIVGAGKQGIATPILAAAGGPAYGAKPCEVDAPLGTVMTENHRGIATPVMVRQNHGETPCARVDDSLSTVTTQDNRNTLATPVLAYANQGDVQSGSVEQPLRTVVAGGLHAAVASPVVAEYYGSSKTADSPDSPLGAVVTHDRFGVATPVIGELTEAWIERARTVGKMLKAHLGDRVTLNAQGMVEVTLRGIVYVIVDVLFRMLMVHELAAAMGFPADYRWPLNRKGTINQREAVKLIGNAISVANGAALIGAMLPELRRDRLEEVA